MLRLNLLNSHPIFRFILFNVKFVFNFLNLTKVLLTFLIVLNITSCGENGTSDLSSETPEDETDGNGGGGGNPPVGTIDESNFWVRLYDDGAFPFHQHKSTGFSDECKILSTSNYEEIECMVEINELDLYFNKLAFHYNIPSGLCDYVRITPYYFYNQEVGYGPSSVTMNVTFTDNNLTAHSCTVDGVSPGASSCTIDNTTAEFTEINFKPESTSLSCVYDRTDRGGKNCCFGDYTLTVNSTIIDTNAATTVSTSTTSDRNWGGNWKDCYGGPVKTGGWNLFSKSGRVASSLQKLDAKKGLNKTLSFPSIIDSVNAGENMSMANYYDSTGLHDHVNIDSIFNSTTPETSSLPYFIDPIDDRSGTPLPRANPSYMFECIDKNMEVKNRMKMYIREWDVYSDYLVYITTGGLTATSDRYSDGESNPDLGLPGSFCDGIGSLCDDFIDLDDVVRGLGGSYDQSTLNNAITKRRSFFPEIQY